MHCLEVVTVQVTRDRLLRDAVAEEQGIAFGKAFGSGYPGGEPWHASVLPGACRAVRRHSIHADLGRPDTMHWHSDSL